MPRITALEALERFRRDGAWSAQTLDALVRKNGLDERDAALAARLFYGALQNLALCDFILSQYARGKLEPKVRDILRLGVYQLAFMDRVPARAAVSESVRLCRSLGYDRAAGLVNAVLRRVSDDRNALPEPPGKGSGKYLSVRYSHPRALVDELIALRGYKGAEAVLAANNAPAPVFIQTNTRRADPAALCAALGGRPFGDGDAGADGCIALEHGNVFRTPEFLAGHFYVQDPAAHAAVVCAGLRPGMRVLDVCAAPGGKSFAAAIAMDDTGEVRARDISGSKLNLVMDGADRMGLSCVRCEERDARTTEPSADFDVVFADVPCSGLGVIRKKPDVRYRDLAALSYLPALQAELLEAAAGAVRPGGVLVYSTCTWRPCENGDITAAFLKKHTDFTAGSERTFWPDIDGTDGFYICRMERKNEI